MISSIKRLDRTNNRKVLLKRGVNDQLYKKTRQISNVNTIEMRLNEVWLMSYYNQVPTFAVSVFLHVPDGVLLVQHLVGHYLVLPVAPVWQLPPGELEGLAGVHVNQANLQDNTRLLEPAGLLVWVLF